jgi:3-hydroxyacyl-CoA dehydrogenase/enoyl-CoA hydratase/3-hydroxybutyryl-CoA epimerase/enoyl-CoA isomerase
LEIIARWSEPQPPLTSTQIVDRLLLPMLLEAARMIEERVVRRPDDIDLGVICGLGFPVRQGGLLYWADRQGLPEVLARSQALTPLGPRFEPPAIMAAMAKAGDRFADLDDHSLEGAIHPLPSS